MYMSKSLDEFALIIQSWCLGCQSNLLILLYLVISSSAACEHNWICATSSSVANSTACWGYKGDRMTGLQESYFCLSSQDFRVFSKA